MPMPLSGKPMADRESEVVAQIASGVSGLNAAAWDRLGTGDADRDYLRRLASTDEGSIFAREGELVQAFGHIARMIGTCLTTRSAASGGSMLNRVVCQTKRR